jgi:hypothetical protein
LLVSVLAVALCGGIASPAWAQGGGSSADGLVPYQTPSGGTISADARLVPGLDVLTGVDGGRELVDALARAGVTVVVAAEPRGVWAHFDPGARLVAVDRSLAGADPRTVAALLSHEAAHVQQYRGGPVGTQARATASACLADEYQAIMTELRVWQELFGPGGKAPAVHRYEREQNVELARYRQGPAAYWGGVVADYASVCGQP